MADTGRYSSWNRAYPGLEHIHQGPNILVVRDFFTPEECAALVSKAGTALSRSVVRSSTRGSHRTSSGAVVAQREIPTLVQKMCELLNCDATRLERCSLIRYRRGEYYKPHCDEDEGADSMNGFSASHRLVTLQVLLNT